MKKILSAALFFSLAIASFGQAQEIAKPAIIIPDGTQILVALTVPLSSSTAKIGDHVTLEVTDDVVVGDKIVIAKGAAASGTVTEAKSKGILGQPGVLNFSVDYVVAFNGQNVTIVDQASGKEGDKNFLKAAAVGMLLKPAAFLVHGQEATFTAHKPFAVIVRGDRRVEIPDAN